MLRLLQIGNNLPTSFIVDPSAEFQPGQVAQLTVMGNQIVCGVSDGTAPIGLIDDVKTNSFTSTSIDEVIETVVTSTTSVNGKLVTTSDIKIELANPNILSNSFLSDIDVALIPRNGVIIFPAGTPLNVDLSGGGVPDGVRAVVNYAYQVPNVLGDDSTQGSGRVSIWWGRMFVATDQYETNQRYSVNAPLYVSESGLLTTRQAHPNYSPVGMVTGTPSSTQNFLELLWL